MDYPKGTTKEQWDKYELDQRNHEAWVKGRRDYLECILSTVQNYSIDYARSYFNRLLDETLSMDAPNKPGYYRANND
jgi:hypothetical protein